MQITVCKDILSFYSLVYNSLNWDSKYTLIYISRYQPPISRPAHVTKFRSP